MHYKKAPIAIVTSYDKKVDYITTIRVIRQWGVSPYIEYLVKWKELLESETS